MSPEWERAVRAGDITALERQVAAGYDIDALDRYGQTALMLAAMYGVTPTAVWLVEHGADLDHTAKFGLSALMIAAVNGRHDIVGLLVAAGADQELRGSGAPGFAGKTARDLAAARGDDTTLQLLRDDGTQ
jgi:hypothetical protein